MSFRPLTESLTYDQAKIKVIHEGKDDQKHYYMEGVFIQGGVVNENKRVYPVEQIQKAVGTIKERLNSGYSVMGEADHPQGLQINIDRVSHMIENMWMDGPDGFGKLKIMPTPMGKIVSTLLESGCKLGVSSRGAGNVGNDGKVSDFEIVTVDIVAQPSAPDAYPKAIYEGLLNMHGGMGLLNLSRDAVYDRRAEKHLANEITKIITELRLK